MDLGPDSKGWCRVFHLWKKPELWGKGFGSEVLELRYKDGNRLLVKAWPAELYAFLGDSWYCLCEYARFLWIWKCWEETEELGWVLFILRWGQHQARRYREAFSWHLPRVWTACWQHNCGSSASSWAETTGPFPVTRLLGLKVPEPQWTHKGKYNPQKGTPKQKRSQVEHLE